VFKTTNSKVSFGDGTRYFGIEIELLRDPRVAAALPPLVYDISLDPRPRGPIHLFQL